MMSGTILHGMILTGMTILMSDDLSASCSNAGMMIPTKRRTLLHTHYIHSPIFSRHLATFTSPAKEVGWGDWREGSNPSFSAKKKGTQRVSFFLALFKEKGEIRRERPALRQAKIPPVEGFLVPRAGGGTAPVPPGESLLLRQTPENADVLGDISISDPFIYKPSSGVHMAESGA